MQKRSGRMLRKYIFCSEMKKIWGKILSYDRAIVKCIFFENACQSRG